MPSGLSRRLSQLSAGTVFLLALFLGLSQTSAAGPKREIRSPGLGGGMLAHAPLHDLEDRIPDDVRRSLEASIAAYKRAGKALAAPKTDITYPFYPQAGILGKDLFTVNFVDMDPTRNVLDWDCTGYTYDGHRGHDSMIRSFREQEIGVPIFAALDGRVVETHDGEEDMNTSWINPPPANYVVLDHGGGYFAFYWHMKRGSVAVEQDQLVTAGTQLGLTGSSGMSTGPHLHFESWKNGLWFEPSAGRCRSGDSYWRNQPPVARDFYVADAYLSNESPGVATDLEILLDETPRISTFLTGPRRVSMRMDYRNLPGGSSWWIRLVNPRGATVVNVAGTWGNSFFFRAGTGTFWTEADFTPGRWRFLLDVNDSTVVDAPFTIVPSRIVNRRPNPIRVRLTPGAPVAGQIMTCEVLTSLISEDPDYDLVRYTYVWRVRNRVVRSVTTAALSDVLAKGIAQPRDRVTCRVTPSDGRANGASAVAAVEAVLPPS